MSDSANLDAALTALLLNDPTLKALMPDGVYFDVAAQDAQRYVVISLVDAADVQQFGGRAFERPLYIIKAVALGTSGADVRTAAARIDALLDNGTLAADGYAVTAVYRESRFRLTEIDNDDPGIRWQHRGGRYRVEASPL